MALVKYIGGYRRVYVPEAGLSVEKGNSITVSSGVASSLLLQVGTWEAGDKETEELAPPPSPAAVPHWRSACPDDGPVAAQKKASINTNFTTDGVPHQIQNQTWSRLEQRRGDGADALRRCRQRSHDGLENRRDQRRRNRSHPWVSRRCRRHLLGPNLQVVGADMGFSLSIEGHEIGQPATPGEPEGEGGTTSSSPQRRSGQAGNCTKSSLDCPESRSSSATQERRRSKKAKC